MVRVLVVIFFMISGPAFGDCVALIHGLARSPNSMAILSGELRDKGYGTILANYPSTEKNIDSLTNEVMKDAAARCAFSARMHIVTHSLGGILVRNYLKSNSIPNLGRVVMVGPPNKGSKLIDELKDVPGFTLVNGPAGFQLGADKNSLPNRLGKVDFDLGVIAGDASINPLYSKIIPGEDDGKVSVASTKVAGMADHITLHVSHTFMMNDPEVGRQIIQFLRAGKFQH